LLAALEQAELVAWCRLGQNEIVRMQPAVEDFHMNKQASLNIFAVTTTE
jgi:hypothetical protein